MVISVCNWALQPILIQFLQSFLRRVYMTIKVFGCVECT